jgi:hypothetical protein
MDEVTCPVEGCDYVGEPQSVEAHISAKSNRSHIGKLGRDYREEMSAQLEESEETPATEEGEEPDTGESEAPESDVAEPEPSPVVQPEEGTEAPETPESDVEEESTSEEKEPSEETGGGDGMGLVVAAAVVAFLWFMTQTRNRGTTVGAAGVRRR